MKRLVVLCLALWGCLQTQHLVAQTVPPKVLQLARSAPFSSLDPQRQYDADSDRALRPVFDTLLGYAYLKRPATLEPVLLARMPQVSADGRTYTLELKPGVHFHHCSCFAGGKGRELTSEDVLYTFKRFADANVNAKSYALLEGMVVGLDAFRAASRNASGPQAVEKLKSPASRPSESTP